MAFKAIIGIITAMLMSMAASAQVTSAPVTLVDIRAAMVGKWKGQLEYRDYQADRWFGLPVSVSIEMMRDGLTLVRHADFDDGPVTGIVTITGLALFDPKSNREQSVSFRKGRDAELDVATLQLTRAEAIDRWTIEAIRDGKDNNRAARIRETTTRNGATMVTLKEVDFLDDSGEAWLTRNRTTLTRE